jgi:hypothetical protein
VIHAQGTEDEPIVITGVPDGGVWPVINGDGAETPLSLDYWNEARSVLKIGGSSIPGGPPPAWVVVQGLDIRNGHSDFPFNDDHEAFDLYADNAACIHVESGSQIVLRGNTLSGCGNGLFVSSDTEDLLVSANNIYGNGNVDSAYEHNSYTEARGITFEFNRYGPLRAGSDGSNLKDRSAGLTIRHNFIEGGNRQLDLVDGGAVADHEGYDTTLVYGNILWEPGDDGNSQIVHYGGDGADSSSYRKGTLHFYQNTVVSERSGTTTLLRLSTTEETAVLRNNVIHATAGGHRLALMSGTGDVDLDLNWMTEGWIHTHEATVDGTITEGETLTGTDPDLEEDFRPSADSPVLDASGPLAPGVDEIIWEYLQHQAGQVRLDAGSFELGALESDLAGD